MKASLFIIAALLATVAGLSRASAATHAGVTVTTASSKLGRVLVDARGRTLYLFEKDKPSRSACAGTCATYWPPLLTRGMPLASGGVKKSLLGIARRADGTAQVTYAGHPLYRFVQDTRRGQTTGEDLHDFGAGWYAVSRSGKKVEQDGS